MVAAAVAGDEGGRQRTSGNGHDKSPPWRGPRAEPLAVLVVDDQPSVCASLEWLCTSRWPGCRVEAAPSVAAALAVLESTRIDVAIVDVRLGLGGNGLDLIAEIRRRWPATRCAVLTAWKDKAVEKAAASCGVEVFEKLPSELARLLAQVG